MKIRRTATALLCSAILAGASGAMSSAIAGGTVTVPGWPAYLAMGGIGGPDVSPLTASSTNGSDDFQGKPVDVIFKYAGAWGDGDPGIIDAPMNALQMTGDLTTLSGINNHATRVAIVEYTYNLSGELQPYDFSNSSAAQPATTLEPHGYASYAYDNTNYLSGLYIMPKHFITLGLDAQALDSEPVTYNGSSYYGTLILDPDMLGTIQQQSYTSTVNTALPAGAVDTAVDQALCFLTTTHSYQNESAPNGAGPVYVGKTYNGTPLQILQAMLNDGYPTWSLNGPEDGFWPVSPNNIIYALSAQGFPESTGNESVVATWFDSCLSNPAYNHTTYQRPTFAAGLDGWIQANNWMIRTFSTKGHVTFGWHENMWTVTGGFWLDADLTSSQIATNYSTPVTTFLQANAPSAISSSAPLGATYAPDYFVFDRYEYDDSAAPGAGTLYNARSWDNYLAGIGQISTNFNNIPVMMWQIPGGHIPNTTETQPEFYNSQVGASDGYVFSTAPVYFFGDSNLTANLSNIIMGTPTSNTNLAVGAYSMTAICGSTEYNCVAGVTDYQQYLLSYQGQLNNFNWSQDNGKLAKAAANNVFAILWGGGNTTNVIKNFNNPDDNGWLANKIITYYQNPTPLTPDIAHAHDFNGDSNVSDILWRDTSGNLAMWLMSGGQLSSGANISQVSTIWTVVGSHDFNRDGSSDILWLDNTGNLGVWLMNGTAVTSYVELGNVGTQWAVAGTGDFNGDRNGDILWRNPTTGELAIWLMNGDGQFASGIDFGNVPTVWTVAGTGDFNGDGTTDILWRNTQTGDLSIWLMKNGQLSSGLDLGTVSTDWSVVGTADFNGDGTSDILWRDGSGNLAIWGITNGQMTSGTVLGQVPLAWSVSETGDFDGDGKSDILWHDTAGDMGVWLMNGLTVNSQIGLGNVGTSWQPQGSAAD
jgi:hypothetical protein